MQNNKKKKRKEKTKKQAYTFIDFYPLTIFLAGFWYRGADVSQSVMLAPPYLKWPFASWAIAREKGSNLITGGEESQTAGTAARERHDALAYLHRDNCFDSGLRLMRYGDGGGGEISVWCACRTPRSAQSLTVKIITYAKNGLNWIDFMPKMEWNRFISSQV